MQTVVLHHEKNVTPVRLDPAWDTARELLQMGRDCAGRLAAEIERLRGIFLRQGQGRRTDIEPSSQIVTKVQPSGFQAQLAAQLGLHPMQASRILEAADYQRRIESCAAAEIGEEIAWEEDGERRTLTVTAEHKAQAEQAIAGLALPGATRPSRAWAGIMGEGTRVGTKGSGKVDRQPIDHAKNIARGLTALQTSLPHWKDLSADERFALESAWAKLVLPLLPATFAVTAK